MKRAAGLEAVQIITIEEGSKKGKDLTNNNEEVDVNSPVADQALPGDPSFFFENV